MPTGGNENTKVDRRLAAILAADIAGYSALMGSDEARTVRDLKGHQAVVLPMIASFGGRVIDTAGDGILAEFASVVNAVEVRPGYPEDNAGAQCVGRSRPAHAIPDRRQPGRRRL
jgi:class 3 adenylate cyclase